jgi:hypothetical protein
MWEHELIKPGRRVCGRNVDFDKTDFWHYKDMTSQAKKDNDQRREKLARNMM